MVVLLILHLMFSRLHHHLPTLPETFPSLPRLRSRSSESSERFTRVFHPSGRNRSRNPQKPHVPSADGVAQRSAPWNCGCRPFGRGAFVRSAVVKLRYALILALAAPFTRLDHCFL